jgi:signal transduction histidine kinase
MSAHSWISIAACAGHLALALLIFIQRVRSPLKLPLVLLMLDVFAWNFADLAYSISDKVAWHWIDRATSPISVPLAIHVAVIFIGRARALRSFIALNYVAFASLFLWADSAQWPLVFLTAIILSMGVTLALLFAHLQRTQDAEERTRTRLLLAALGIGTVFGSFDLWYDLLPISIKLPPLSNLGTLLATAMFATVTMRFRLLGRELSPKWALVALTLAGLGTAAYLAIFSWLKTPGAIVVLGVATAALVALAAAREVTFSADIRRERTHHLTTMGRFSQQLAHDLKNPLTALAGALQFLRKERDRGRSLAEHAEYLDLMEEQVARMRTTIDDYQRIGRVEPLRKFVEVNQLVRSVLALQPFAASSSIAVKVSLAESLPQCPVDRDLVSGALENLLRNSFDAMPSGGEVVVRTEATPRGVALVVQDQGNGMDARQLERAFDDFYTTKANGTGLGLAFVRRVAEAHGGRVSMTSQLGRGTVVRLELPLQEHRGAP